MLAQNLGTDGISFAIPVNMVRGVMDQILAHGRVRRGWLGVSVRGSAARDGGGAGHRSAGRAAHQQRRPARTAALVGLQRDDLVTHLNGQPILNAQEALNRVAAMAPGSIARTFRRGAARSD